MPTVRDIPRRLTLPTGESVPNVWHPSLGGGPLGHSDRRLTATGWERNTRDALAVARTEREGWEDSLRAGRVGICPTVTPEGVCDCPRTRTRGKACERIILATEADISARTERARLTGHADDAYTVPVAWLHPLAPCSAPAGGRCGCPSKAGALVWIAPSPESAGTYRHAGRPRATR